ncbi:bacillithiol biosynthesis cysteine-adding enzyme BshC [Marinicrinis sediminis]|uniref:Putative cysteine ligase BshC n=1 Tax=Marinicrinis sediminis TaxID=1652465 RepID=A0ABW5RBL8_9BACL
MECTAYPRPLQTWLQQYMDEATPMRQWYDYMPQQEEDWKARADWLDQAVHLRADRRQLVEVLRAYNTRIAQSDLAMKQIEALQDPQTLVVIGGQQAGLLTGPMMVIYKALTIIHTAREAEKRLDRKVVPVFWVAGEDHDFEEVHVTEILSPSGETVRIALDRELSSGQSVSDIPIPQAHWDQVLEQLDGALLDTEFKPDIMARLRHIHASSSDLSEAFSRILAWLFQDYGLVLMDAADPQLRELESDMFVSLVQQQQPLSEALMQQAARLQSEGFALQAEPEAHAAHLFYQHENGRKLLFAEGEVFTDRKHTFQLSRTELEDIARQSPQKLSNNVFTRPLMQEFLLPVLGAVLGPAEIAYWGMLKPAFHLQDMRMPLLIPRQEFTLVEGTVQKHLRKYGLEAADIVERFADKREAWLREQDSLQVEERFTDAKKQFQEMYAPLVEMLQEIHPGIYKLGQTNLQKIQEQIEFLSQKAQDADQSRHTAALRQWDKMKMSLHPHDKYQERVYNVFAYLNKYGLKWLEELMSTPYSKSLHHWIYL